jgi:hypothetical protein
MKAFTLILGKINFQHQIKPTLQLIVNNTHQENVEMFQLIAKVNIGSFTLSNPKLTKLVNQHLQVEEHVQHYIVQEIKRLDSTKNVLRG